MNESVNESISRSIFNATRTGNGFNKVIMHILPSRQEREILVEATRTLGSITSREGRPDTRERRKSSLLEHAFG